MKIIYLSNSPSQTQHALDSGVDLVLTPNLNDMTRPDKTIYILTGAGFTRNHSEAMVHGYLNKNREPLRVTSKEPKYPLAINSQMYQDNFRYRIEYLRAHTRRPYGIYVGGSHNLIEHCIPNGKQVSNSIWATGFERTHKFDHDVPSYQYIMDVWEKITFSMIEQALDTFYEVEEILTGFKNPAVKMTKKTSSMACDGVEVYGVMSRLKTIYSNWHNVYFNCFHKDNYTKDAEIGLANMKNQIQSVGLGDHIYAGLSGEGALTGYLKKESTICREAGISGGAFLAYMTNCRAGVLIDTPRFTPLMKDKINIIKKYPSISLDSNILNETI